MIGNRPDLRLGPTIHADDPDMARVAQMTTHLTPVGLYLPLTLRWLRPASTPLIHRPHFPALLAKEHQTYYGKDVELTGQVRANRR